MIRKITTLASVSALGLALAACGGAENTDQTEAIDSGIHGIEVPADVENEERSDEIYVADLPHWDYEDASNWMDESLPTGQSVENMEYAGDASDDMGQDWCWSSEQNDAGEYEILSVFVGSGDEENPPHVSIISGADEVGCTVS